MPVVLRAWLDRTSLRAGESADVHLVVELEAEAAAVESRPGLTTVLALDVSGSMQGPPLDHVIRSVDRLLDGLTPVDQVGVVSFASDAEIVVSPVRVDAAGKRLVRSRVAQLFAEGSTDLEAGIDLAVQVLGLAEPGTRRGVVVLSDGVPNQGAVTAAALATQVRRYRAIASFATLGYGAQHDEDLLAALADAGGGAYQYVPDPASCGRAFAMAVGAQADVAADAIELTVAPAQGVEVARVLGGAAARVSREGLVLPLPDLTPGARQLVALALRIAPPSAKRFLVDVAQLTLRSRVPGSGAPSVLTQVVTAEVAAREPHVVREAARRLMLVRADEVLGEARALADRRNFAGAVAHLRGLLAEMGRVPGFDASDGSALADARELVADAIAAMDQQPDAESYAAFRKNGAASRLALAAPAPSARGPVSARLLEEMAGDAPVAELVVLNGPNAGTRHRLVDRCIIGRLGACDLSVPHASLAGRHAEVYASDGAFFVRDFHTTNGTRLRGQLLREVTKLAPGDVLVLGEVEIRYEER
ncbi:MAG: hypothetical protein JWP97_4377 [Labilithrix sp.]|nr:hypothetical protein [Labilithrix sp.]